MTKMKISENQTLITKGPFKKSEKYSVSSLLLGCQRYSDPVFLLEDLFLSHSYYIYLLNTNDIHTMPRGILRPF